MPDEPSTFRRIGERILYEGHVISLVEGTFATGDTTFTRDVVRHPGAVSIVAVDADGQVVLVRQYRAPLDRELLEIPAGKLDVPGEPPLDTARRELAEEVGLAAESWELLASFHNSPGFCDEVGHVYLARELTEVPQDLQGIEEESMTVHRVPLDTVPDLIAAGELTDAKSIIGLLLALRRAES